MSETPDPASGESRSIPWRLVLGVAIALYALLFLLLNDDKQSVDFVFFTVNTRLPWLILLSMALGAALGSGVPTDPLPPDCAQADGRSVASELKPANSPMELTLKPVIATAPLHASSAGARSCYPIASWVGASPSGFKALPGALRRPGPLR